MSLPFLRYLISVLLLDECYLSLEVKEVSDDVKYLGEFPVLTENITLVLGRITPVNPNRDSPNGYPTVTPTELQPITLAH